MVLRAQGEGCREFHLPLQELWVVSDDSHEVHQMALAIEHVRYKGASMEVTLWSKL